MKLRTVELKNYRCYEKNDFHFGSDTTLIIGKNGTGKSSLLSAIRKGMSFIFSNTGSNELIKNNSNKIEGLNDWDTTYLEFGEGFQWPTNIGYEIETDDDSISWKFYKDKYGGKLHPTYYKSAQQKFQKHYLIESNILPLLGFYGDCYPHKRKENNKVVNDFNKILTKSISLPRDIGYALWSDEGSITSSWFLRTKFILNEIQKDVDSIKIISEEINELQKRLSSFSVVDDINASLIQIKTLDQRLNLIKKRYNDQTRPLEKEYEFVTEKVMQFFSNIGELDTDDLILFDIKKRRTEKSEALFFSFGKKNSINEGVFNEEALPMGYMRLLHIVYDIAYRWYLLNGEALLFDGLVLIDELELHLHPSLQQTVLQRFRKTFPGLQFIVTTHSPIILSNFNADEESTKIIQLEKKDGIYIDEELPNLFSMDYNSNLVNVMGVNISNKLLDAYINAFRFLNGENNPMAKDYYQKIEDLFDGKIPDFIKEKL
ncbi:MAG: AAA family ATPase [Candidatus Chryseobacterium colombiense]|nr:AAA family ATPase [Chryseobacterium sp.]WEK70979.1 MAG: AAA family ATPase [Chryseobacterium sp.]